MQHFQSTSESKQNEKQNNRNLIVDSSQTPLVRTSTPKAHANLLDTERDVASKRYCASSDCPSFVQTMLDVATHVSDAPSVESARVLPSLSVVGTVAAEQTILSTRVSDNEDAVCGNFVAPELNAGTLPKQLFAPAATVRSFELIVDIGLVRESNQRTAEIVCLMLKGAGLRQHSESVWTGIGCGIEEATDSLSDVFLELQSLGAILNESLRHVRVTMHEERQAND